MKILIAGVGGLGSIVSEICARIGINELTIFDLDIVTEENLNRMIYNENNVGEPKVNVIKKYISKINSTVKINSYYGDIMSFEMEDSFYEAMEKCDIAFLCLDNVPARQFFNSVAIDTNTIYLDAGVLRSGMGGYIHLCIPKQTACYQCTGIISTNDVKGVPCTASIPTVINMIASLQAHHMIKYFLEFGEISDYISYNAFTDKVFHGKLTRDPNCSICGDE